MMYASADESRIDVILLFRRLWDQKWTIVLSTLVFGILGALFAFVATPVYLAEAVLAPNQPDERSSLPAGLGSLSSLAGITLGASVDNTEALAVLQSRIFIEDFIEQRNLLPVLFEEQWDAESSAWLGDDPEDWPDIRDGVTYFIEEVRSVTEDASTGIVSLKIEWSDPETAADWAEDLVLRINERLRTRDLNESQQKLEYLNAQLAQANLVELRQSISRLIESEIQTITLAKAESEYAFRVIDPPRVPKAPVFPRRIPIILVALILGGMVGVGLALVLGWMRNTEAVQKSDDRT